MTNCEAVLRLFCDSPSNTGDTLAITSLHSNNADVLRGAINRYFGEGRVADKAEAKRAQKA
jgi:hypothetical protein